MIRRITVIIFMIIVFLATGCIKETYDMNNLSDKVHLTPSMAISAIRGDISIADLVDSGDTVVFDQDNFIRIIFKEDSVINIQLADFYDLNDMVSYSKSYILGEMSIAPFYETMNFSLDQISENFSAPLRSQFVSLDGTTNNFPSFPSTSLVDSNFPAITNFEHAVFASGILEISIMNNLPAPLNGVTIQLYNIADNSLIGNEATITLIQPGELGLTTIDLANVTVTNNIGASIVLTGSPGTSTPVLIDLNGSGIEAGIRGKDLKVKSGRIILPVQTIESLNNNDTITFDAGNDVELTELKINTGNLSYDIQSLSPLTASIGIVLPTALRSGIAVSESIDAIPGTTASGTIDVDNTSIDLGSDPAKPYNRVPLEYSVTVSSDGSMIDFNQDDEINLNVSLMDPDLDYAKGYFGQQNETIDPDSVNLEIEDILSNISGDFLIASPSITLNYNNSFAIPMEINLDVTGKDKTETIPLDLDPIIISYPDAPASRDIEGSFSIDKSNSSLPALISMPPEIIRFAGSAMMNPSGNTGTRDNYVFGDSRFLGSLEVEVPMEFSMNMQFKDTLDNFLADAFDEESDFNWDDFESFEIDFNIDNGFPLGVSLSMALYDSVGKQVLSSIGSGELLKAAPVDAAGKATGTSQSSTQIVFTKDFFDKINSADEVILTFTMNTSENKVVKIYSDYKINFKAALVMKPDIIINKK